MAQYTFNYETDSPNGVNGLSTVAHGNVTLVDGDSIRFISPNGVDYTDGCLAQRRLICNNVNVSGEASEAIATGAVWRGDVPLSGSLMSSNVAADTQRFTLPIIDTPISPSVPQPNGKGFQSANGGIIELFRNWGKALWDGGGGGPYGRGCKYSFSLAASAVAVQSNPWTFFFDPATGNLDFNIPGSGTTSYPITQFSVTRGATVAAGNLIEIGGTLIQGISWKNMRFANGDPGHPGGEGYALKINPVTAENCLIDNISAQNCNYHHVGFVCTQSNKNNVIRGCTFSTLTSQLSGGATSGVFYGGTAASNSYVEGCIMENCTVYLDGGYHPDGTHRKANAGGTLRSITFLYAHSAGGEARVKDVLSRNNVVYHDHTMYNAWGGVRGAFFPPALDYGANTVTPQGDPTLYESQAYRLDGNTYYGVITWQQVSASMGMRRCKVYGPANFNTGLTTPADLNVYWPNSNMGGLIGPIRNTINATAVIEHNEFIGAWRCVNTNGFCFLTTGQATSLDSVATGGTFVANNRMTVQGNTLINNVAAADVAFVGLFGYPSGSPSSGTQGFFPTGYIVRDNIVAFPNASAKAGFARDQWQYLTVRTSALQLPVFSGNWLPDMGLSTALVSNQSTDANVGTGNSVQTNMASVAKWTNTNNDTNFTPGSANVWNTSVQFVDATASGALAAGSPVRTSFVGRTATPTTTYLNGVPGNNAGAYGYGYPNGVTDSGGSGSVVIAE